KAVAISSPCRISSETASKPSMRAAARVSFQLQHREGVADIGQDRQATEARDHFAQESEPLASNIIRLKRQPSDVAARSRQTVDKSVWDRVPCRGKHDRYDRCRLLCREDLWGSRRDNNVDLEPDEVGRDLSEALGAAFRPTILDCDGAALDPIEFT